ncbi:unnamed protein product [Schistosoma mattheei]|uniref:DUF7041 domain-containing protein n=1 Tax=Schistosoma mattheei TaxID=31246 RepID=A0A183PAI6_9TREM|nr:unnamed protein product [Schistosoma mattheei]
MSPPSIQLMPFWPDNIEAWSYYEEAEIHEHGVNDTRAQFLAVVNALPRQFNRYVTPSLFTSGASETYETLKRSILKRVDLTDSQRLDRLLNNIDLQHGSATDMLQRMGEVIGQRTFDDDLVKQLFLSKLPQQVQAVLVSFQDNAVDDRILDITKPPNFEQTESLSLRMAKGVLNAVKGDTEYTAARPIYGTILRLPEGFMDPSSSSRNMDLSSNTIKLTDAMDSAKPVSTRPHSTDAFVQSVIRYSTISLLCFASSVRLDGNNLEKRKW